MSAASTFVRQAVVSGARVHGTRVYGSNERQSTGCKGWSMACTHAHRCSVTSAAWTTGNTGGERERKKEREREGERYGPIERFKGWVKPGQRPPGVQAAGYPEVCVRVCVGCGCVREGLVRTLIIRLSAKWQMQRKRARATHT